MDHTKNKMKLGCLIWGAILLMLCLFLLGYLTGVTFSFAMLYWFALLAFYSIIQYLPFLTLPLAIFCLIRRKKMKRSIFAIVVLLALMLLEPVRGVDLGITVYRLDEASIWVHLSNICYIYLFYYWADIIFRRNGKKAQPE